MAGIGWDTNSAVEGGAAGASTGNPYAAAAMFVIGGVLGGMKKKRAERRYKEAKRLYNAAISPEYLAKLTAKNVPLMRQQISKGGAAGIQSSIAGNIASAGLTGTGTGLAIKNMAATAPEIAAFNNALAQASGQANAKAAMYGARLGIAGDAIHPAGGFTPGYGQALAGLYGMGSAMYKNYQAAKAGQSFSPSQGNYISTPGDYSGGLAPLYPKKDPLERIM